MQVSWITEIFSRLQAKFTYRWTTAFDDDEVLAIAMDEWANELAGLTGAQIKHGLKSINTTFPPAPHEFKALCLGGNEHSGAAYKPFDRDSAIELKCDKDAARVELKKMKGMLK